MIVCHCKGITDRDLRRLGAGEGAERVAAHAEAGTACGGCRPLVRALLEGSKAASTDRAGAPRQRR